MIGSTSRGGGFRGVLNYVFGPGKHDKPDRATIIGGTMMGRGPQSLAREFGELRAMRPDIKNPVKHISLRNPEGEPLSPETWVEIAHELAKRKGWDTYVVVAHDDEGPDIHPHMVASRITQDGRVIREEAFDVKDIEVLCREMEIKHGLTRVASPERSAAGKKLANTVKKPTRDQVKMVERTGKESSMGRLQKLVSSAMAHAKNPDELAAVLAESGVDVRWNMKSQKIAGVSFLIEGDDKPMSGTALGTDFKWAALSRQMETNQSKEITDASQSRIPRTFRQPSIADRRAVRAQRAERFERAATAAARIEALPGHAEAVLEPGAIPVERVLVPVGHAVDERRERAAQGAGPEPGVGSELGLGDRRGPGAGAGLGDGDRGGPGQADDRPGVVGRDAGRVEAGRPGGTPEPGHGAGPRPGSESERGSIPDPAPQRPAPVALTSVLKKGEQPEWMGGKHLPFGSVATPEELPGLAQELRVKSRSTLEGLRDKLGKYDMLREETYVRQAFNLGPIPRPALPWAERQADLVRDALALGQARAEAQVRAQAIALIQAQAEAGIKARRDAQAETHRQARPGAIPDWLLSEKAQNRDAFGDQWALTHEPIGPGLKTPAQLQEVAAQAGLDCSLTDKLSRPWDLPRLVEEADRKYGDTNKGRAEWTVRQQNNLRERGQAYYQRPWILRQPELVLDGWRKVREKLGHALQEAQDVVGRSTALRFVKDHLESFRLPFQERRQAAQEVARTAWEIQTQHPQKPKEAPLKSLKDRDKGVRR